MITSHLGFLSSWCIQWTGENTVWFSIFQSKWTSSPLWLQHVMLESSPSSAQLPSSVQLQTRGTKDKLSCPCCSLRRGLFHLFRGEISVQRMLVPVDCEGVANAKPCPELQSLARFACLHSRQSHLLCSCLYRYFCQVSRVRTLWVSMGPQTLSCSQVFIPYTCIILVLFCLQLYENVNELISNCFKSGRL